MASEIKLTASEASILRSAISQFVVRKRTGELGILHGMDRFVSTNQCFKKKDLTALSQACKKLGLSRGIPETNK